MLAHKQEEFVPIDQLHTCEQTLRRWLGVDA
jgi:succinyl-diaminopimelate desuccinylase